MATLRVGKGLPTVPIRRSSSTFNATDGSTDGAALDNDVAAPEPIVSEEPARDDKDVWISLKKQAKFIILGGLPVWYLDVPGSVMYVLAHGGEDWTRILALVATAFLASTCTIFAYVVLLPARGVSPNYTQWNRDPHLRGLIPALTISIVGGYLSLLLLLSPLCNPKPSLGTVLPKVLAERLELAAKSADSNIEEISQSVYALASKASSSLLSSLHQPAAPVRGNWFSSSAAGLDGKRLLQALQISNVETLGKQLGVNSKKVKEFSKALEKGLRNVNQQSLQAGLLKLRETAAAASNDRHSPEWWAKKGVFGWLRAFIGSGSAYLLVFGTMGLLGLFGTSQAAAARRAEARAKQSL